jgi:membrane-bound inhibitor of C-type lysozyme
MRPIGITMAAALAGAAIASLARGQDFQTFHCADGTEFVTAFYAGTRSAYVQLDGKALTLPRRISVTRPRYAAGNITLWMKDGRATLRRDQVSTECTAD